MLNWRIKLFSIFFGLLFVGLGVWQIERGQSKTALIEQAKILANLPGEVMRPGLVVANGDPVRLRGTFNADKVIFLDNRVISGRVGYEVVQLFDDISGVQVLVNRGFVPGKRTRQELPEVPATYQGIQDLRGHAYLTEMDMPENNVLGEEPPWVVQVVKPTHMGLFEPAVFSHTIRLEAHHPDALPQHWPVTTMTPERHYGYSLTWFLMAGAVLAIFIYTTSKAKQRASKQ